MNPVVKNLIFIYLVIINNNMQENFFVYYVKDKLIDNKSPLVFI